MPTASQTISQRIADAAGRDFVGRRQELELLRPAADARDDAPVLVAFVHGPGGIGKSRLLEVAAGAVPEGTTVMRLDCRAIEPTPAGLLGAMAEALGAPRADADLARVARLVRGVPGRIVLTLDTYERLAILDTWVRQALLPAMPDSLLTIIAGRDPPVAGWLTTPGWAGLVRRLHLGPLGQADAMLMLRSRGLGELQAARVNAFARGHPLALELAAAAVRDDPALRIGTGPPPVVIGRLLDALVADLPERTIETLEASSTARRVTEPILRALLDREDVRDEFDALRRLPFVELTRDGLVLHDVVREVIAGDLAARDPEAHARYRRRAWRYFEDRARRPRSEGLWEVTADLIYLIGNPVLRNACFPVGSSEHAVEPAVAADGPAILGIVGTHEPPGPAALLARWWARHPASFAVARGPDAAIGAFVQVAEISGIDRSLMDDDPVARAWAAHLGATPPREGDRVLAMRRWLGRDSGEMLSPAVGSCWLDVKRVYMELRPRLSRLYSVMSDFDELAPIFVPLGFAPVGDPVDLGGVRQQPVWLDFGDGSVNGWLTRLVNAELGAAEEAVLAAPGGEGVQTLTPREREVLALIAEGLSNRGIGRRLVIRTERPSAPREASHVTVRRRDRHPRDPRHGAELLVAGPGLPDGERVAELQGHRARRDRDPQQVQGADRALGVRRHAVPVLRPLPRRGGAPVRRHRGGDRRGRPDGEAHDGLEHLPERDRHRLRRVRGGGRPDHRLRALEGGRARRVGHVRLTRTRAEVVTLVATWRELSALAAGARMAHGLMLADANAPAEARDMLARVLADYDAACARLGREETGSPG